MTFRILQDYYFYIGYDKDDYNFDIGFKNKFSFPGFEFYFEIWHLTIYIGKDSLNERFLWGEKN